MMHSLDKLLAFAATCSVLVTALSSETSLLDDNAGQGKISIKMETRQAHRFDLHYSMYMTHLKYNATIPEKLRKTVEESIHLKRDQGSAVATPSNDAHVAYVAPVSIGTPPQILRLNFDTGSSDFWVFSTETSWEDYTFQRLYGPGQSSTSKALPGLKWNISYADGSSCNGDVFTDVVRVGGLVVQNATVECAQRVSRSFAADTDIDGIVGMGFDKLNTIKPKGQTTSFFTKMKSTLSEPVFTADIRDTGSGTYKFGYIDHSLYTGNLSFSPVDPSLEYWNFTSSGYSVGSGAFVPLNISGVADTGTTLMYLPNNVVRSYYSSIKGAAPDHTGSWYAPCKTAFPTFTFGVGSARITIPSTYMNYGSDSTGSCMGALQASDTIGANIFGDVALKSAFVVFDYGSTPSVGWATKPLKF